MGWAQGEETPCTSWQSCVGAHSREALLPHQGVQTLDLTLLSLMG